LLAPAFTFEKTASGFRSNFFELTSKYFPIVKSWLYFLIVYSAFGFGFHLRAESANAKLETTGRSSGFSEVNHTDTNLLAETDREEYGYHKTDDSSRPDDTLTSHVNDSAFQTGYVNSSNQFAATFSDAGAGGADPKALAALTSISGGFDAGGGGSGGSGSGAGGTLTFHSPPPGGGSGNGTGPILTFNGPGGDGGGTVAPGGGDGVDSVHPGFAPESPAFAVVSSICACTALWVCRRKRAHD
jgi:hypothetical protein